VDLSLTAAADAVPICCGRPFAAGGPASPAAPAPRRRLNHVRACPREVGRRPGLIREASARRRPQRPHRLRARQARAPASRLTTPPLCAPTSASRKPDNQSPISPPLTRRQIPPPPVRGRLTRKPAHPPRWPAYPPPARRRLATAHRNSSPKPAKVRRAHMTACTAAHTTSGFVAGATSDDTVRNSCYRKSLRGRHEYRPIRAQPHSSSTTLPRRSTLRYVP